MKRHWQYLKYILRNKWFVLLACADCGVPFWRALMHDWHKFLPSEWFPYLNTFYAADGSSQYQETTEFAEAWRKHQHRGKHHWQHWLLTWDRGVTEPLLMPEVYVREMVADWWGAGRAIFGKWDAPGWYEKNKDKMLLAPETRDLVEVLLQETAPMRELCS
jgi:hypothetical protein